MPAIFTLDVATEPAARRAILRLSHAGGQFIAAHDVDLTQHTDADWHSLFDTRRHIRSLEGITTPAVSLAAIGRFLGEHVLGPEIVRVLADGVNSRTLLVRLPSDPEDRLAAAFARVPWEIARAPGDDRTLGSRNVVLRAALEGEEPARETSIIVGPSEPVRVLLVFAETPGQRPLAARQERERLLSLFFDDVLPSRNVEVDVLCHGVTRRRIEAHVQARGGYHVVHWSGHGHVNALEIALDEGEKAAPQLSGEELVGIFARAGGFIPPVVFLGACHSGSMVRVKDWESLRASLGEGSGVREADVPVLDKVLEEQPGFTGTALSLVRAGVKQVVAMRYEVSDTYARRLATRVYRGMFADRAHHAVDAAVALARGDLARDKKREGEYHAVDHATPLVFGSEPVRLVPGNRRSAQVDRRSPKPQPLLPSGSRELDTPRGFVGRGEELTQLQQDWLEDRERPIALIQGLPGLGKTSLAAEAVHLWFGRFDYVLAFQARGGALGVEELYRRLDQRLVLASKAYRDRCRDDEMAKVYLPPGTADLKGAEREEALGNNLIDALGKERVLLVLDNFETNLLSTPKADSTYACGDPAWERLFEALADRLGRTGSRVLVTTRHKPAALEGKSLWVPLGPLRMVEAALFLQGQTPLRELWYGDDVARALAMRILDVSRGHPLILGRIADLARGYYDKIYGLTPAGRQAIQGALTKIRGDGFKTLPDLFAGVRGGKDKEQERRYLEEVAVGAVDLLIERLSPEARTLLWIVSLAGEPATEGMIGAVWGAVPASLLGELCGTGLLARESEDSYALHELVAERAAAWMDLHPGERGGRTEVEVWKAYGEWYGEAFRRLFGSGKRELAVDAGGRGIRYLVRARAFESLSRFVSGVITSTVSPSLLRSILALLQTVEAEAGELRWHIRTDIADVLRMAERADEALPFYEQAASDAETAGNDDALGVIYYNWGNALVMVSQLDRAREVYQRCVTAKRRTGISRLAIVTCELGCLRIDVLQGHAADALPDIEERLSEVRTWWAQHQNGAPIPGAPDGELLARVFLGALGIARAANVELDRWQASLALQDEIEGTERALGYGEHQLAISRMNRYWPLLKLGKVDDAMAVLVECREVYREVGDETRELRAIGAQADVWNRLGDSHQAVALAQRVLALSERLPSPNDRAISHLNLSIYLHNEGLRAETPAHLLAALAYCLVMGIAPRDALNIIEGFIKQATARGDRFELPRLANILATPAFAPLRAFLDERGVSTADLQTAIDTAVEQVRANLAAELGGAIETGFQNPAAQWPGWAWLWDTLRSAGLDPTSAKLLPSLESPSSWVILAKPSELLKQHFELAPQVLILCVPRDVIQESDIKRAETIFGEDLRIDPGFALVITADPDAETKLGPILPDSRRYLFVRDETLRTAIDPQAFLHDLLRDGLGRRRLFDFRLPASEWQFFGREKELEALERDVLSGHSLGVFGLRKVGKTSLLERMAEKLREGRAGFQRGIPVKVDLQTTSYLRRNFDGVAELIGSALDRELSRAHIQVPESPSHPLERLRAAVEHVEHTIQARVVLMLDEYEVLLDARRIPQRDGVELLTWLRGLAQERPRGFSLVLAGRNQRLLAPARIDDADNPMYRFLRSIPVAGLVPGDCRRMVRALGGRMGLHFEPDALDLIVQETGGHPALVRTLGDLVDMHVPTSERNPAIIDAALVKRILPRFSREVDEDMREFVNAANDFDARAGDYLVHLAHGVLWIGGPSEARIDDALVGYGILQPDTHEFRIGRLLTWLRENHQSPAEIAHG